MSHRGVHLWFLPHETGDVLWLWVEWRAVTWAGPTPRMGAACLRPSCPSCASCPSRPSHRSPHRLGSRSLEGWHQGAAPCCSGVGTGQVPGFPVSWQAWGGGSAQTQVGSSWSCMARPLPSFQPVCPTFLEVPVQSRLQEGACSLCPSTSVRDCRCR